MITGVSYKFPHGELNSEDLERNVDLSIKVKEARKLIEIQYSELDIKLYKLFSAKDKEGAYCVFINGDDEHSIRHAWRGFIDICGVPKYVLEGKDVLELALDKYGRKLKTEKIRKTTREKVVNR
jgi:hypothetical protein